MMTGRKTLKRFNSIKRKRFKQSRRGGALLQIPDWLTNMFSSSKSTRKSSTRTKTNK
jgi:hypothetical protein